MELVTDRRGKSFAKGFPARRVHALPAATPSGKDRLGKAAAALTLGLGTLKALALVRRLDPAAIVGFGGYPTVAPLMAASMLKVLTILHEQNAVLGRANRFLAKRVDMIATGFATVAGCDQALLAKTRHVGNPVRPVVVEAAQTPYDPPREGGVLRLLVFGGSQGARIMSDIVPDAVARLSAPERARLDVVQQVRQEDFARVRAAYAEAGVEADLSPFFRDLPFHMARSQLVVARAGASTVAEISVIGRPSILVPLPGSLDQDQAGNAKSLADIGAATMLAQAQFEPDALAEMLVVHPGDAFAPGRHGDARTQRRNSRRRGAHGRSRDRGGTNAGEEDASRGRRLTGRATTGARKSSFDAWAMIGICV